MKKFKKYLITIIVGLLIAFWVAFTQGIFEQTDIKLILHILTDSFFVSGVLITGMGGLIFVSNEGSFDGITFAMKSFFAIFKKDKKKVYRSYYDYKQSKKDRDRSFGYMLICGLVFLAMSGIVLLFYSNC